jgi:molybdenum cofactor cytidylyltransferase
MTARHFAIVPAAGNSARMGRPKLLLALSGRPLIAHVIGAWERSSVDRIVVVIRPDDIALAEVVQSGGRVERVIPATPPPDMKASIQAALEHIEDRLNPAKGDGFLVAPADMPRLSPAIIDRLIQGHLAEPAANVLVPTIHGRRGHPTLFSWQLAAEVHRLGVDEGLNCIVDRQLPRLVPCEDLIAGGEYPFADIDTPEQYRQLAGDEYQPEA